MPDTIIYSELRTWNTRNIYTDAVLYKVATWKAQRPWNANLSFYNLHQVNSFIHILCFVLHAMFII